jgi:GDP-D-mannose dehydratase
VNPEFYRPAEVELLIGDPSKAEKLLGWKRAISYNDLISRMVGNDLQLVENLKKMKNVAIIGASGFVGPYLVQEFTQAGYSVFPVDLPEVDILNEKR